MLNQIIPKEDHNRERLWLAIRLPNIHLEALGISPDNHNILITHKGKVCAATHNIIEQGITLETPSSTAQLLHRSDDNTPLRIYEREPHSEDKYLDKLCQQLYNYTPYIEIYRSPVSDSLEDIGIVLEISSCLQLFKGFYSIVELINESLNQNHIHYQIAQGHTKHLAWLLSYSQQKISKDYSRKDYLKQLEALDLDFIHAHPQSVEALKKSGFFHFRDIIQHIETTSFASLRKRFDPELLTYLCDTLEIDAHLQQASLFQKPLRYYQTQLSFCESIQFDYPVNSSEQLLQAMETLLEQLCDMLVKRQMQSQCIQWNMFDIYHNCESLSIRFERLYRDPQLVIELCRIQVENQELPFDVDTLELQCDNLQAIHFSHDTLGTHIQSKAEAHAFATLSAKLNATLGDNAVYTLSPKDNHIPELSFQQQEIDHQIEEAPAHYMTDKQIKTDRPSWIFNIPVKIGKRQNELFWKGKLELLQGPERIEGYWWVKPTGRDYFVAKRDDHVRLWVFYDLYKEEWFVHGVFV